MKTTSLFIMTHEPSAGGLLVSMGLMSILKQKINKVAYFRPIIDSESYKDNNIDFMINHFNLDISYKKAYGLTVKEAESKIASGKQHELFEEIIDHFKTLERQYDFVLCQGITNSSLQASLDFDINIEIAKNISSPIVNILNGHKKDIKDIVEKLHIEANAIKDEGCAHFATFINRLDKKDMDYINNTKNLLDRPVFCLPEIEELNLPTVGQVRDILKSDLILGEEKDLMRIVKRSLVAAMTTEHFLDRLDDGVLVIAPGDRLELVLSAIAANSSKTYPSISGIVINGDFSLKHSPILKLIKGIKEFANIPVLTYPENSYNTAVLINSISPKITHDSQRKIALALGTFSKNVPQVDIEKAIDTTKSGSITPVMFEYSLFERARRQMKKIDLI